MTKETQQTTSSADRPQTYTPTTHDLAERIKIDLDPEEALKVLLRPTKPKK